ncbi:uncharacterized protein LOC144620473 isoform X2 [Crassostrea virginica]
MSYYLLALLFVTWETEALLCETSADCPQEAKCCRNSNGDTLPLQEGIIERGLDCYRPMSGICCPLYRCYKRNLGKTTTGRVLSKPKTST